MNAKTPTLNPFSNSDSKQPSHWVLVSVAILLGIATAAGVLLWRWPTIAASAAANASAQAPADLTPGTKTRITSQSKDWDFYTAEIDNVITELRTQRETYEKKTKELASVEMRIEAEKQELTRLRSDIEKMRDDLTAQTTELLTSEKSNVRSLAKTYSSMKPSQAVAILAEMSDPNVVKLLATMKSDIVAKILGEMARTPDPSAPAGSKATLATRAALVSDQLRLFRNQQSATP